MREKPGILPGKNPFDRGLRFPRSLRPVWLKREAKQADEWSMVIPFSSFHTGEDLLYAAASPHLLAPVQGRTMDQSRQPHGQAVPAGERMLDFYPLRLILQPSGTLLELTRPDMLIGRHSDADVRLPLPDVSRRHCRCLFIDGSWHILDLNSLNGIWVNDTPVPQAVLRQGDVLTIGSFTFAVDLSARQLDPVTEVENEASPRRAILKALPPQPEVRERRRAS